LGAADAIGGQSGRQSHDAANQEKYPGLGKWKEILGYSIAAKRHEPRHKHDDALPLANCTLRHRKAEAW
jgi:hypothetical protein